MQCLRDGFGKLVGSCYSCFCECSLCKEIVTYTPSDEVVRSLRDIRGRRPEGTGGVPSLVTNDVQRKLVFVFLLFSYLSGVLFLITCTYV